MILYDFALLGFQWENIPARSSRTFASVDRLLDILWRSLTPMRDSEGENGSRERRPLEKAVTFYRGRSSDRATPTGECTPDLRKCWLIAETIEDHQHLRASRKKRTETESIGFTYKRCRLYCEYAPGRVAPTSSQKSRREQTANLRRWHRDAGYRSAQGRRGRESERSCWLYMVCMFLIFCART